MFITLYGLSNKHELAMLLLSSYNEEIQIA